jgi:hypothetical protein
VSVTYTTNYRLGKHDFNDATWHDTVNGNMDDIDDIFAALAGFTNATVWKNSTAYVVGNRAIDPDLNSIWVCNVNHTSVASPTTFASTRSSNPTYWTVVSANWSSMELANELNFTNVTGSQALTANTPYRVTAAATVTLPSMNAGEAVIIARDLAAGTITVARNGQTIDGLSSDFVMDVDKDVYIFIRISAGAIVTRRIAKLPTANATASLAYPSATVFGLSVGSRQTSSFAASSNTFYPVAPGSNTTVTLPASPTDGDKIGFAVFYSSSGYTFSIAPNGKKINGSTSTLAMGTIIETFFITYDSTLGDWT